MTPALAVAPCVVDPFGNFHRWWFDRLDLDGTIAGVTGALERHGLSDDTDEIAEQVRADLTGALGLLSLRVLLGEFHDLRRRLGHPLDPGSTRALAAFAEHLADPAFAAAIIDRAPLLHTRAARLRTDRGAALREAVEHLGAHRGELIAHGWVADGEAVAGLNGSGGDHHQRGRRVISWRFASGATVVYKPHSLSSDHLGAALLAAVDPFVRHDVGACVPPSIDHGTYGFQPFVPADAASDRAGLERYFYRYGALCAVLPAIGATDLHNENVVAAGDRPIVVDTESLLSCGVGVDDSLPGRLAEHLNVSPPAALLLPCRNAAAPVDVMVSAVGVERAQVVNRPFPRLVDDGTDAVRLTWTTTELDAHDANLPTLGGEIASASRHRTVLIDGLVDALAAVRSGALERVLDHHPPVRIRTITRATFVYGRFLDASQHPKHMGSAEAHSAAFDHLRPIPFVEPRHGAAMLDAERRALRRGDIPFFDGASTSRWVHADGAPVAALATSPCDHAQRGLRLTAERPDEYHRALAEACLAEVADESDDLFTGSVFATPFARADVRPYDAVAQLLARQAIPYEGPDGVELGWLLATGDPAMTLSAGTALGFHDAGGIVAFLGRLAGHDASWAATHAAARRGLLASLRLDERYRGVHPLLVQPMSVFGGMASMAMSVPDADDAWIETCWGAATPAPTQLPAASGRDLMSGPPGLLMVACADPRLRRRIGPARMGELVASTQATFADRADDAEPWNVAHGPVGLAWALARAGGVLGRAELLATSRQWFETRIDGPLPAGPGWCHGAAGVSLALAEAAAITRSSPLGAAVDELIVQTDGVLRAAWRSVLDGTGPVDVSVCHGASGVVQSLLALSGLLRRPELQVEATELHRRLVAAIPVRGARTGRPTTVACLGYLLGWSGLADTDLLVHRAAIGRPVTLPVTLSTNPFEEVTRDLEVLRDH